MNRSLLTEGSVASREQSSGGRTTEFVRIVRVVVGVIESSLVSRGRGSRGNQARGGGQCRRRLRID